MADRPAGTRDSWTAFESRLRRYVRRRLDPASVDDAVGEILLRLAQNQDVLRAADNPLAWALRVAANAVADHHRRRASERRALSRVAAEPDLDPVSPEVGEGAGAGPAAAEIAQCLVPLIRELPEPYREALLRTEIDGLTQAEAAARAGVSVSGMKSRVQRGRARLKRELLRCCEIELDRRGGVMNYRRRSTCPCG